MATSVMLFLFVLSFLILVAESTLTPSLYVCSNSMYPNATESSYKANLRFVLNSLVSNSTSRFGYYKASSGGSGDTVYGSFLCKGDLSPDFCRECVVNVTQTILRRCPDSVWSVLWFDQCMVRYSDSNFSTFETEPSLPGYNEENIVVKPEKFYAVLEKTVRTLENRLSVDYSKAEKKYATTEAKVTETETIYTMAQCTPDMNVSECKRCLEIAASRIQKGKIGGRLLLPSCFVRFEIYPFYKINSKGKKTFPMAIVVLIIAAILAFTGAFVVGYLLICIKRRKMKNHSREDPIAKAGTSELHALQFPLITIELATNNFSSDNKLGEGGFGPVYKGKLPTGEEIAAKRLSRSSGQGVEEFKNEIELVAKLQHRNLVRLLGFSLEREETILVYDYVPNGSLDHTLFDPNISGTLDWSMRYKIMVGVARGLLYLHEDSRLRIIHRDLKASNILLDADMNPKISDFGMARIFCADQNEASTNRIVGTYGYMSPEYIMFGHFSTKSDVFSFGVLVLEIVTGKKNSTFQPQSFDEGLLGFVWKHWSEGVPLELIDPALGYSYSVNEVVRCIHIGLLCVQDDAQDRPTMDSVVLMLNSESISLPLLPHRPSFFYPSRKQKQPSPLSLKLDQSTEKPNSWSKNDENLHIEPDPR